MTSSQAPGEIGPGRLAWGVPTPTHSYCPLWDPGVKDLALEFYYTWW